MMNRSWPGGDANPKIIVNYNDKENNTIPIPFYLHCVGAFSYYSRKCLEEVGLLCEEYYNACEHVDHTLQIIKAGMHPPFWYFADIPDSSKYLGDEEWSLQQSTISSRPDHQKLMTEADQIFLKRNGCYPGQIPDSTLQEFGTTLKKIKTKYGI
jgi:hypothetical protein